MSTPAVVEAYSAGRVTASTLIWKKGQGDWKGVFEVPELEAALRAAGHSPAGVRTPVAPAPGPASFDDEDEATRVVDSTSLPALAPPSVPRPKAKGPPPLPPPRSARPARTDDGVVTSAPAVPSASAAPRVHGFDDESEATKVIDPHRAEQLLSAPDAALPPAPPRAPEPSFDDQDEATRVLDTETAASKLRPAALADDEEDDITQVASAAAARELLEQVAPEVAALRKATGVAPASKPPGEEPLVVVAKAATGAEAPPAAPGPAPPQAPPPAPPQAAPTSTASFSIQNEPTRIVNVRRKTNTVSLIVGLVVVVLASAAGGFLASRFVPPRPAPTPSQHP
jgi:hypothetical protein